MAIAVIFRRRRAWAWVLTGGLAIALPACGTRYIGTTAGSFLKHARESNDPNLRYLAYTKLADPNCYTQDSQRDEAVDVLSQSLSGREQSVAMRAAICKTLGRLERPAARPALLAAMRDPEPLIRAEACRAIGQVGTQEDALALAQVMTTDTSRDCRIAAIDAISRLEVTDPRIQLKLAEGMRNPDPAIRASSYAALQEVTGEDLGLDYQPWHQLATNRLAAEGGSDPLATPPPGTGADAAVLQASGESPSQPPPPPLPR